MVSWRNVKYFRRKIPSRLVESQNSHGFFNTVHAAAIFETFRNPSGLIFNVFLFLLKVNHRKIQVPETAYWFRIKTWIGTFSRLSSTRKHSFNSHAVGMNSWVQTAFKLILCETLFLDQQHIFSLLSSNFFVLSSVFRAKKRFTLCFNSTAGGWSLWRL